MKISSYIKQDKYYLTLVSNKTSVGYCFKVNKKDSTYFVSVMTGTMFEKYFTFLGYYREDDLSSFLHQKSDPKKSELTEFKAFEYFLKNLDKVESNPNLKILRKFIKC